MALTQISTGGVKDDAVTAGKIPANAVGSSEIADDAVDQGAIADEAVDEARLQISNAGTNGQFLQKQSGNTGGLTWATASSTPTVITVADESSDTSCNIAFFTAATGDLAPKTGDNLTFNSSTGELEADIIKDSNGDVRLLKQNAKTADYTLVAADSGTYIRVDVSSKTITIPASVMAQGSMVTIINNASSGDVTIAQGSGFNLTNSSDGSTGDRTLASRGICTILFTIDSRGYISGSGLS